MFIFFSFFLLSFKKKFNAIFVEKGEARRGVDKPQG